MEFADIYATIRNTCLLLAAAASVVAGFRIYQRWNRGDDVETALLSWLGGLGFVGLADHAVKSIIVGGTYAFFTAESGARLLSNGILGLCYVIGVIVAILGLINIVNKFRAGEDDIYPYMLKWAGSLLFLFSMGAIISAML